MGSHTQVRGGTRTAESCFKIRGCAPCCTGTTPGTQVSSVDPSSSVYWPSDISHLSVCWVICPSLWSPTMSFRIYKSVLAAVNKTQEGHPFKAFLELDISIPEATLVSTMENLANRINTVLASLKSVILVENIVESVKFCLTMYLLSYVGALMTGLTLLTLTWTAAFSLPRLYRDNQTKIDEAILPLKTKLEEVQEKLSASLPAAITGKKEE